MFQLNPIQMTEIQKPRGAKTETTCVIFKLGSLSIKLWAGFFLPATFFILLQIVLMSSHLARS